MAEPMAQLKTLRHSAFAGWAKALQCTDLDKSIMLCIVYC